MWVRRAGTGGAAVADILGIGSGPTLKSVLPPPVWSGPPQYTTSYTVAFLSPEPVTMYLSSGETSQLSTDEDSLDWGGGGRERGEEERESRYDSLLNAPHKRHICISKTGSNYYYNS